MRKYIITLLLSCMAFICNAQNHTIASYYGGNFHGRKTASGEVFNKNDLTCAHKTLPFGTYVEITSVRTKKSVIVKVNDRGPFIKGREFDLSEYAAKMIGIDGIGKVTWKIVDAPLELQVSPWCPIRMNILSKEYQYDFLLKDYNFKIYHENDSPYVFIIIEKYKINDL